MVDLVGEFQVVFATLSDGIIFNERTGYMGIYQTAKYRGKEAI